MRYIFPWELRCVLGGNGFESEILILRGALEQDCHVLALYNHTLLLIYILIMGTRIEDKYKFVISDRFRRRSQRSYHCVIYLVMETAETFILCFVLAVTDCYNLF